MKYGKKLKFGDTIGFIGPSGAVRTEGTIERAVAETEKMGFRVKLGESCGKAYGYLSGTDEVRARDVNKMFLDDGVDAIFCLKGGYGTMRMLDLLDYEAIAAHPKIFVGYSDITAMHIAFLEKAGLATFHGPMPVSSWADGEMDALTRESFFRTLMQDKPAGELVNAPDYPRQTVVPGECEGLLVGGNLSLIVGLLGTPYELDTRGRILFIEDVGEKTYAIDRMLTHLRLAGKFDDCAGVVLGDFKNCEIEYPDYGFTLGEIVRDVIVPCGKPIFSGLQSGHCTPKLTLPFGVKCRMDAGKCALTVLESAVC
ncbi:MAG: LD-carboxypeptidase [Clostridia bacterium]|nr:LD-carboxypeptidase [Clostridia bacterium]